ncbi:hypothetical protein N9934_01795 [Desulfosarcina sp.]|nr:hypothetical protein [Desulfosarcina sp.]
MREAGLTEGEIKVYLALLELGSSTSGPIIERSKVSRSIIYTLLDNLIEKGLVSFVTKEKTKYFQASEPQKILDYIEEREEKLQENKKKVEKMLPELMLKKGMAKTSEVNVYMGFKGLTTAFEHLYSKLKKGGKYYCLGIPSYQRETHHLYWQRDHVRRAKAGITVQLLFSKKAPKKVLVNRNSYAGSDARYTPTDIDTPANFVIYADTVLIILQEPNEITIEIINKGIADSFMAYFEEFWKLSKKFKK